MSAKKKTKETTNVFSIPVFGAEKVGKSAVSLRYAKDQFKSLIMPTIEEKYTKAFVVESVAYRVNIIDTSSSDEFKSLRPNYIKNSDTFYIVFDLCLKSSFDKVDSFYDLIKEIKKDEPFTCVLIGNKCEISLTERGDSCVSNFDIIKKAEKMKANYFDVSAKQDINIQKSFENLVFSQYSKRITTTTKKKPLLSIFKSTVSEDEQPVYISKNFYSQDE
eukprot:gene3885-7098_t